MARRFCTFFVAMITMFMALQINVEAAVLGHVNGQVVAGPISPVIIEPVSPVSRPGLPNEIGLSAPVSVTDEGDHTVAEVVSDKSGAFSLDLAPGRYKFDVVECPTAGAAKPLVVEVREGQITQVKILCDTGIRSHD